jgi:hypothetical protein
VSFPDVEAKLVELLGPYGMYKDEDGNIVQGATTYTSPDLQEVVATGAFYVVVKAGGGPQTRLQWKPGIQVAVYGKDRGALACAEDICEFLTQSVSRHYPFDRIDVQTSPQETPWPSDDVWLWTATYTAVVRRQS